jgi:peptidoglycan/LPS O-acetylase OafA/YrhL
MTFIGYGRRYLSFSNPLLRWARDASYPVYILHQTVIVVAAYNLKPFGIAPLPEGLLLAALTFAACFGGYEIIRRVGWLRPLFGLGRRAPAREVGNGVQPVS